MTLSFRRRYCERRVRMADPTNLNARVENGKPVESTLNVSGRAGCAVPSGVLRFPGRAKERAFPEVYGGSARRDPMPGQRSGCLLFLGIRWAWRLASQCGLMDRERNGGLCESELAPQLDKRTKFGRAPVHRRVLGIRLLFHGHGVEEGRHEEQRLYWGDSACAKRRWQTRSVQCECRRFPCGSVFWREGYAAILRRDGSVM